MTTVPLGDVLRHRKEFFQIQDDVEYQRVRIRLHVQGVEPRDRIKGHEIKTKRQQACRPGDFIVAEIDAKVGGYGFIPGELDGAIVSSHYFLFEVDETRLLPEYLAFCIRAPWFGAQISAQGSTNYAAIRPHDVLAIQIPLPSLDEQKRRSAHLQKVLGDVESLSAIYSVQATDVAELRRAILDDAVRGRLTERDPDDEPAEALLKRIAAEKQRRFKAGEIRKPKALPPVGADEAPFEVPEGWTWTRLLAISQAVVDGDHQAPPKADEGIPFVTISNLSAGFAQTDTGKYVSIDYYDAVGEFRQPQPGDVLIAVTASIGKVALVRSDAPFSFQRHIGLIRPGREVEPRFVYYLVQSKMMLDSYHRIATGTAQKTIPLSGLRKLAVPLPPVEEQRRIVERVDHMMALCDRLEARLGAAAEDAGRLAQAVLAEALAG